MLASWWAVGGYKCGPMCGHTIDHNWVVYVTRVYGIKYMAYVYNLRGIFGNWSGSWLISNQSISMVNKFVTGNQIIIIGDQMGKWLTGIQFGHY